MGSSEVPGPLKAAIIDQGHTVYPNQGFIEEATRYLEGWGFAVDLYQGDEVTVDLYRHLPGYGYQVMIFRAHSTVVLDEKKPNHGTWLFTGEPYSSTKYVVEQQSVDLARAKVGEGYPWLFAVGSRFVSQKMNGRFPDSVVIMMGCAPMYFQDLTRAFIWKGASMCLGWNQMAALDYLDDATLKLLSKLVAQEMTVEQAIEEVMSTIGPDPGYNAVLKCYPLKDADKSLRELLKRDKAHF